MSNKVNVPIGNYIDFFDFRLLKRNYCCKCCRKLKIKFLRYRKLNDFGSFTMSEQHYTFCYYCEKCNYYIDYKNQKIINKYLSKTNVETKKCEDLIRKHKINLIKKGKWFIEQ